MKAQLVKTGKLGTYVVITMPLDAAQKLLGIVDLLNGHHDKEKVQAMREFDDGLRNLWKVPDVE